MKQNKTKLVIAVLLIALLFTGCIGVDRSFRNMRDYVLSYSGNEFEKEFEFSFGSISIGMAELVLDFAETEEPIDEILSEIDNVQIGIYNNLSSSKVKSSLEELKFITNKMESAGWDCIVRSVNKDEMTAIFLKYNEETLNQLFVVSVNNDEVALVEILGNLNKVIEIAIREKGLDFAMKH